MAFITWDDSMSVGISEMDEQHKKFIPIINELNDAMKFGKGSTVLLQILQKISSYTVIHFKAEEAFMLSQGFPGLPQHAKKHREFEKQVEGFLTDLRANKTLLSLEIMNAIKQWLIDHIQKVDKQYGQYCNKKR
ncbi:MAG: hemerythrin family protein [Chitinivibrionales bacterium]|nr:hemerythrin family protein [Chitinivibrionales bacterium]